MQTWSFSALGVLGFHENIKGIYNDDENNKDDNNKEKDKNKNNNSDKGISAMGFDRDMGFSQVHQGHQRHQR